MDGLHLFLLFGFEGCYNCRGVSHLFEAVLQVAESVWVKASSLFFHELFHTFPFALAVAIDTNVNTRAEDLRTEGSNKSLILHTVLFKFLSIKDIISNFSIAEKGWCWDTTFIYGRICNLVGSTYQPLSYNFFSILQKWTFPSRTMSVTACQQHFFFK